MDGAIKVPAEEWNCDSVVFLCLVLVLDWGRSIRYRYFGGLGLSAIVTCFVPNKTSGVHQGNYRAGRFLLIRWRKCEALEGSSAEAIVQMNKFDAYTFPTLHGQRGMKQMG